MRKTIRLAVLAIIGLVALTLGGCSMTSGGMGSGEDMGVWGYVVSGSEAQLEVAETQGAADVVVVDRVLSPEQAWLVVHINDNGKPGERIGLVPVAEGESENVSVPLQGAAGVESAIVALHADKGTEGRFDFSMEEPTTSPDRPYFVDEKELARVTALAK
jgi:hypothetical protein